MAQRSAAWRYGWRLGLIAAGFAAAQVLVMVTAARAATTQISTLQYSLQNITYPGSVLGALLVMVVLTYFAAVVTGIIMLYLAYQAGHIAVSASGRKDDGAVAGLWVAVVSGAIWIILSLLAVVATHADGTLTGVFTSNPTGPLQLSQVIALGVQEAVLALIGVGLGAAFGARGGSVAARRASPFAQAIPGQWPPLATAYAGQYGAGSPWAPGAPQPRWPTTYPGQYPPPPPGQPFVLAHPPASPAAPSSPSSPSASPAPSSSPASDSSAGDASPRAGNAPSPAPNDAPSHNPGTGPAS